jgi:hypothetical protein
VRTSTAVVVVVGTAALAAAIYVYVEGRTRDRFERLRTFQLRRRSANSKLMACIIRFRAEAERRAGQSQIIGYAVGAFVALASGGDFKTALKAMKDSRAFYARLKGAIPDCAVEAADAEAEWKALELEAQALGIDMDIGEEELGRLILAAEGGYQAFRDNEAQERARIYQLCRDRGGSDADCLNPGALPLYACNTDDKGKTTCGYRTQAWFRGQTSTLSPTNGSAPAPVRVTTKG